MSDVPENAPQHCPGSGSAEAGKASACAGCPNQNLCASGPVGPDPAIEIIRNRLANVKHKILILSGKGGVGKSTVTSLLGHGLSKRDPNINVGVLDADICGPSQPRVLGVRGEQVHSSGSGWSPVVGVLDADICGPSQPRVLGVRGEQVHSSGSGWSPVYVTDNLSLMSIGFLLGSPDDAVIWRGPKKNGMIKQFLSEVDWGDLDYLLIDTPPGTSDEHLSTVQYLCGGGAGGGAQAVLVTTPQEVALLDVRKELDFCRKLSIPVLGVVENMSVFVCPACNVQSELFPATTGGAAALCSDAGLRLLGRLPLDPRLARCCDSGRDYLAELPNAPAAQALTSIANEIVAACENSSL